MSMTYNTSIVKSGLVLYLDAANTKSYPGSGTVWSDLVTSSTGTLANTPGFNSASGGSITLDGINQHVSTSLPLNPVDPYTVLMWAKPDALGTSTATRRTPLVGPGPVWNPGFWAHQTNIRAHGDTQYRDNTIDWSDLGWKMIGMTYDSTDVYNIFNELLTGGTTTVYAPANPTTFLIGGETQAGNTTTNWDGEISLTIMYDRVLTAAEITQNFEALRGRYGV